MIEQDTAATARRLGQYELLDRLSDSPFGPRWRVRRGVGDAARALRVITTEAPERFASAASAVRSVEHPSLLPPMELVRPGRGLAIITEDVPGETLRSLLDRALRQGESIPESVALRSTIDLLEALQALEQAEGGAPVGPHLHGGLTHDSIHVGADGRTRLLDPGVAAMAAREPGFAKNPLLAAYTAPEHATGGALFDARSDVFSLGVVLWEILACRSLFGAASHAAVIERVLHEPIPRIQRDRFLRGEPVSAALAVIVGRALQRDPLKRFQSYAELADALRSVGRVAEHDEVASFMDGGMRSLSSGLIASIPAPAPPTSTSRPDPPELAVEPAQAPPSLGAEADPPPTTPSARPEPARERARLELLVGTLVLVIGVAVVYSLWDRGASGAPPTSVRPSLQLPIAAPRPEARRPPVDAPRTAAQAGAPAMAPERDSMPSLAPAPSPVFEPLAPAPSAEAAPRPRRPPPARKRPAPPAAPAVYIPDGI